MRIAAALIALALLVPSRTDASPVVFMEFLNSDLTFGTGEPDQRGHDLSSFLVDHVRPDYFVWVSFFAASGSQLVQQTLLHNAGGAVIGSEYLYTGGTYRIELNLDGAGGPNASAFGLFEAPILSLRIVADEDQGSADAWYELGPGLFDENIAAALHIGRQTVDGHVFSNMMLTDRGNRDGIGGNHLTPVRQAWDGGTDIELTVPEPRVALMAVFGIAGVLWRRRLGHAA